MKNVLSIVATVAIASITGIFHVFLLSSVKLTIHTLLYREVVLDYHDTQSQICLDRFQQLLRTILYWQGSRAPWKSLTLKIKIQGLESPWLSVLTLCNPATQKDLQDKITLVKELKKTDLSLFVTLNGVLEKWEMCPWKSLKSPWNFWSKKGYEPGIDKCTLLRIFYELLFQLSKPPWGKWKCNEWVKYLRVLFTKTPNGGYLPHFTKWCNAFGGFVRSRLPKLCQSSGPPAFIPL